ncbi:saccharopine dehydrogenase [Plectosphaerella plurivora]|uniref:Saccharopine dehydrogenase n=1 Tax=Plectosphaerella plurivora TaxID=936078 RepID=A0A9P8VAC3_9PEZI|nr:saccharopine dehydrogenase [Plectosphaerella plurivora]
MPLKNHGRQYDLVVFGATGYTGSLAAEHVAATLPTDLKWAIAGRSQSKLEAIAAECKKINPNRVQPAVEICNLDHQDLDALAKKTFILISTVGPYFQYGEFAFKACAENGTHYFDVTGEVPWVKRMIERYEKSAQESGAMMFPQIGIESAPPDLLTWSLAKTLREKLSAKTGDVTVSIHKLDSAPSGGTLATALGLLGAYPLREIDASYKPYALSPVPNTKKVPAEPFLHRLLGVRTVSELGTLTTSIAGTTDSAIVHRSWGLHSSLPGKTKEAYGPNFTFKEFFRARNWLHGVIIHVGLLIGVIIITTPLRAIIRKFVYQPGQGPEKEVAKKDYIEYRGTAAPDSETATGQIAFGRAYYQGSMYFLSGMLPSQGALTLLEEDVKLPGGVFTPSCLGQPFVDRIGKAGFTLETELKRS